MKCEILKRTAIALFVGGIISASATAEDKSVEAAGSDFGKAIKAEITKQTEAVKTELTNSIAEKADKSAVSEALNKLQTEKASLEDVTKLSENVTEGFNSIQDKVHNLQEALVGDNTENNPGLIKSVSSAVEELNDNIAKKADQSAVDDINAELDARAKALKTLQEEKASVKDLNAISENVKEGFDSIQDKVHNLQEALVGDNTENNPGLIKSVSSAVEELNNNIAKKADKDTVDAELAKKANQADVEANKAEIAKFGAQTNSNAALLLTMAGKVDQNKKDTDEAIAKLEENQDTFNEGFRNELDAANQTLDEHEAAIAKNASAIVNIRNKEVLQNARLDNHGERIEANEAAIGELAKATDKAVTNLGDTVRDLDADLAGTQDAVAENRKDIDVNAVAIDKLKETQTYKDLSKVETLVKDKADKTAVEKNALRITDTRNKQALQNARLDNHGERIEANEAAIGELAKATDKAVTNLGDTVRDLDADLAGTQDAVAENRKDIDKNASRIADTRNKQALQNARLDNHGERIEANEVAIDELAKATNESVTNLGNAVSGLDEDLAGTQDAVAENRKDIDKNASRITDTRNKQVLQNARLDNHGERIDANTVAIDKLKETQTYKDLSKVETLVKDKADKTAVEKNASRITDTRNKQVLQNARLDNHGERIEANKAAIGDLATVIDEAVTNLDGVVNDLHGDLSVTKHTVAENRKDIDKNASRITDTRNKQVLQNARLDNHGERIDANKAVIATNKADIATNKADIATNKADIADSKANIITNRTNITANTAAIATHNQRLDHLDNRVNKLDKDLKRGLAAQAALTGLFQPYTVGKANFTAAVGGYKSQTAVAIGTGYRYNQNIATKAGVAFTQGGGVTYNAGVNFEW